MKAVQLSRTARNWLNKQPTAQMAEKLAEQFTEAYKQGSLASET